METEQKQYRLNKNRKNVALVKINHDTTVKYIDPRKIKVHDIALVFFEMDMEELKEMLDSVKKYGVLKPVLVFEGRIADGHHRWKAAIQHRITQIPYTEWKGSYEELSRYLFNLNVVRRHLSQSQRAILATRIAKLEHGTNRFTKVDSPKELSTQAEVAKMFNISLNSVKRARLVDEQTPKNIVKMVERGELTVHAAAVVSGFEEYEKDTLAKIVDPAEMKQEIMHIKRRHERIEEEPESEAVVPYRDARGIERYIGINTIRGHARRLEKMARDLMLESETFLLYMKSGISIKNDVPFSFFKKAVKQLNEIMEYYNGNE